VLEIIDFFMDTENIIVKIVTFLEYQFHVFSLVNFGAVYQ